MEVGWRCPVCGGSTGRTRVRAVASAAEDGVAPEAFRPSADRFGTTAGAVLACGTCGHASVAAPPDPRAVSAAYAKAADPVSLREDAGRIETARRLLHWVRGLLGPQGGRLLDVGCWTGSLLVAARELGWEAVGIEPSLWASGYARQRGLEVRTTELGTVDFEPASFAVVTLCDVLEHLADPGSAVERVAAWLVPQGALVITVPDAGSLVARLLGPRWWSVLPMHVQYFTRSSLTELGRRHGYRVLAMRTHPKVFSARYYAERLGSFVPAAKIATGLVERLGVADRLVAPDFHDRIAAVLVRER